MPHPTSSYLYDTSRGNPPAAERLVEALWAAMRAADDLLADHGPRCTCSFCSDAKGLLWAMNLAEQSIFCCLSGWEPDGQRYEAPRQTAPAKRGGK
jgi:hypothetical protein